MFTYIITLIVLAALAVLVLGAQQAARYKGLPEPEARRLSARILVASGASAAALLGLAQALRLLLSINGKL